jgi:hypothetical protein
VIPKQAVSIPWTTTDMWRWATIPAANPFIYIPSPNPVTAKDIADDLNNGTRPEFYSHRPIPPSMRERLSLPEFPSDQLPRPVEFGYWYPVSRSAAKMLRQTTAVVRSYEIAGQRFYAAATGVGVFHPWRMAAHAEPRKDWLKRPKLTQDEVEEAARDQLERLRSEKDLAERKAKDERKRENYRNARLAVVARKRAEAEAAAAS